MINLNICLSDIPKDKIREAVNGKKYLDITVTDLQNVDEKGNTHKVAVRQSKEEREAKIPPVYLGRGKEIIFNNAPQPRNTSKNDEKSGYSDPMLNGEENDPLPF